MGMGRAGWESGYLFGRAQARGRGRYRSRYLKNLEWDSETRNRLSTRMVTMLGELGGEV